MEPSELFWPELTRLDALRQIVFCVVGQWRNAVAIHVVGMKTLAIIVDRVERINNLARSSGIGVQQGIDVEGLTVEVAADNHQQGSLN